MSTNSYDYDSLFHPKVEMGDTTSKSSIEYNPTADKGVNGTYKSVVRFVAWWKDPQHSILEKWVCWLVDPISTRGRYVDCPSSVGKPSPLQDMFFRLRKSESVQEQKKSEIFSRRHSFTALVQVIKDDQNKDLQGKIMVWKFGKKVWDKIEAEKKPVIGLPHEPFDLLDGKAFAIVVNKVSGFNNYDQSKFLETKVPLFIKDSVGNLMKINEKTPKQQVFDFLKENSPDLDKYCFKEWDQETHDYVNQVILAVTGKTPSTSYADVRNSKIQTASIDEKSSVSKSGITSTDLNLEDLNAGGDSALPELDLPDLNIQTDSPGLNIEIDDILGNL